MKLDVVEEGVWLIVRGIEILGGGWSGFIEERLFRGIEVDLVVLFSELVLSLFFVDGIVGWGIWCFC